MIGWLILAAVLALCAVLCIRAARFKPEAGFLEFLFCFLS